MRSPDRPAVAADGDDDIDIATGTAHPGASELLASAITREYSALVRSAEVQVSKSGLAQGRDEIVSLAVDLLSAAVARAMERADRWNPDGPVWPWIASFVSNLIRERIRERVAERRRFGRFAADGPDGDADHLGRLVDPESLGQHRLFELLDLVREPDRSLLRLAHVDGLSGLEIAQRLGIKHGAVRVRLLRARQKFDREYHAADQGGRP